MTTPQRGQEMAPGAQIPDRLPAPPPPPPPASGNGWPHEAVTYTTVPQDIIDKVNAGAALVFALYHVRKDDVPWFAAAPDAVSRAYQRACKAYDVSSRNRPA